LHIAAAGGHADVVSHLIDIGAAVDEENAVRFTLWTAMQSPSSQSTYNPECVL